MAEDETASDELIGRPAAPDTGGADPAPLVVPPEVPRADPADLMPPARPRTPAAVPGSAVPGPAVADSAFADSAARTQRPRARPGAAVGRARLARGGRTGRPRPGRR